MKRIIILFVLINCLVLTQGCCKKQLERSIKNETSKVVYRRGNITELASKYVDLSSISDIYKVHNVHRPNKDELQITFINPDSRQRMSITYLSTRPILTEKEIPEYLSYFVGDVMLSAKNKNIIVKPQKAGEFFAHQQKIIYIEYDEYLEGKFWEKVIVGAIGNYEDHFILLQSYGDPKTFDKQAAIDFYSTIILKTNNFDKMF